MKKIELDENIINELGKTPDRVLARKAGVHNSTIRNERIRRGIVSNHGLAGTKRLDKESQEKLQEFIQFTSGKRGRATMISRMTGIPRYRVTAYQMKFSCPTKDDFIKIIAAMEKIKKANQELEIL